MPLCDLHHLIRAKAEHRRAHEADEEGAGAVRGAAVPERTVEEIKRTKRAVLENSIIRFFHALERAVAGLLAPYKV